MEKTMKKMLVLAAAAALFLASCEVQSGITKRSVDKYVNTPTPTPAVTPTPEEPVDPKDIIKVDSSVVGPTLSVDRSGASATLNCEKYNRVMVNIDSQKATVRGACMQIMINGDRNDLTIEATMEVMINGHENTVRYSKFANGRRPRITDNGQGNTVEQASTAGPSRADTKN